MSLIASLRFCRSASAAFVLVVLALWLLVVHLAFRRSWHISNYEGIGRSILNTTLGFEKIFVISLPSRTDHRDWMKLIAAATDLEIEFIDGVRGEDVLDKVLPPPADRSLGNGNIGSWRAHMNAIARVVSENITTALIMEDDTDWDVRIKTQMQNFAMGTRTLIQPLAGTKDVFADPSLKDVRPTSAQPKYQPSEDDFHFDIFQGNEPATTRPRLTPYGDEWDVLWPGHCSNKFPRASDRTPHGRYIMLDDETVVPPGELQTSDPIVFQGYPARTRIVHHVWDPVCTYAYIVSQRGARKILYQLGIKMLDRAFDNMMVDFCDSATCLTVTPQLFSSFRAPGPANRDSDINGFGQDQSTAIRVTGMTDNIVKSVRLNIEDILMNDSVIDPTSPSR